MVTQEGSQAHHGRPEDPKERVAPHEDDLPVPQRLIQLIALEPVSLRRQRVRAALFFGEGRRQSLRREAPDFEVGKSGDELLDGDVAVWLGPAPVLLQGEGLHVLVYDSQ